MKQNNFYHHELFNTQKKTRIIEDVNLLPKCEEQMLKSSHVYIKNLLVQIINDKNIFRNETYY